MGAGSPVAADAEGAGVFVALASLSGVGVEAAAPLADAVSDVAVSDGEVRVRWAEGPEAVVTFEPLRVECG